MSDFFLGIQAAATVVLVGVTGWYAWSTARLISSMQQQTKLLSESLRTMRAQAEMLTVSASVQALAALAARGHGPENEQLKLVSRRLSEIVNQWLRSQAVDS